MLDEYAIRFYGLIEMSLRIDAETALELMTISAYPHMSEESRQNVALSYQEASTDFLADRLDDDDYSGIEILKGNM